MLRITLYALVAVFVVACASKQTIQSDASGGAKLDPAQTAFVTTPENGRYGAQIYHGSGGTTAQIIAGAFARYLKDVHVGHRHQNRDEAIASAREECAEILIEPRILHWEERATEWSGLPDRISVLVAVIDVQSGTEIDRATIDGRSSWWTLGGDHPQDLLPKPAKEYARTLVN